MMKQILNGLIIAGLMMSVFAVPSGSAEPVAKVGDVEISMEELDQASVKAMKALATQIYKIKDKELTKLVEQKLYELEAADTGKSVAEIKKGAAVPADVEISDDAVQVYFELNAKRYKGKTVDQVKKQIQRTLIQQKKSRGKRNLISKLKKKFPVEIFIEEPTIELKTEGYPSRGPKDAKVTIVEFTDFQCPFCSRFKDTTDQAVKEFPKDVRHVFVHLPLAMHKQAKGAHHASVCAEQQGKFWEMREILFANQRALQVEKLSGYATEVGLDMDKFEECMSDTEIDKMLDESVAYASSVGARGTPTSFLMKQGKTGGSLFRGAQPYAALKAEIEKRL